MVLVVSGCATEQSWEVRGRIVGFGDDERTLFVAHENIPGVMPAMTMPFRLAAGETSAGMEHGDDIAFTLHATADSSWISRVRPLAPNADPLILAERRSASAPDSIRIVAQGDMVPDVSLITQDGRALSLSQFRERYVIVNFIYTRCPLPDYCPWMSRQFQAVQSSISGDTAEETVLLSVTVDPVHDTPAVLAKYAERYAGTGASWYFATGEPADIRRFARAFGVAYEADGEEIVHSLVTLLVDREGRLRGLWRGNEWEVEDLLDRFHYLRTNGESPVAETNRLP